MQTVIPTAISLLSCLGTRNQHCQRNGTQITGTPFCHHREHRPQCSHFQNPASAWHQPLHRHRTGLVILVPLSPAGPAGTTRLARNETVLPCGTWPPIPERPPCLPASSRFLFCCFRANLFLSHTEWTPVYNPLGWMRIESQCDKATSRQHCLSTGRIMNTIWNLNVFIRKTKWSQLKKASHNYQIKQLENGSFYFCSYDTSSSC